MTKETLYELPRETKQHKKMSHGLSTSKLSNQSRAEYNIINHDFRERLSRDDESVDCPGILRMNNQADGLNIRLWVLKSLLILPEASKKGRLGLYIDTTKMSGLGFTLAPWKCKILSIKVYWRPGDSFIKCKDKELLNRQYFKGLELSKCIATSNKTPNIHSFLKQIDDDCYKCTGMQIKPLLGNTDLAGQLKNGIFEAFGNEGDVRSQIMYANLVLLIGFHLDKTIRKKLWKQVIG